MDDPGRPAVLAPMPYKDVCMDPDEDLPGIPGGGLRLLASSGVGADELPLPEAALAPRFGPRFGSGRCSCISAGAERFPGICATPCLSSTLAERDRCLGSGLLGPPQLWLLELIVYSRACLV